MAKLQVMSGLILLLVACSMLYLTSEIGDQAKLIQSQEAVASTQAQLTERQSMLIKKQSEALAQELLVQSLAYNFVTMRYWLTDLAVSWMNESEEYAEKHQNESLLQLEQLSASHKEFSEWAGPEIEAYYGLVMQAVDAYIDGNRVLGNSLVVEARNKAMVIDQRLADILLATMEDVKSVGVALQQATKKLADSGQQLKSSAQSVVDGIGVVQSSSMGLLVITIIVGFAAAWVGGKTIAAPLVRLCSTIQHIEQNSDLTLRSDNQSEDEVGKIASSLNKMLDKFQHIINDVTKSSQQIAMTAAEVYQVTEQSSHGVSQQQQDTTQLATAITEMATTVRDVAQNANEAATATQQANDVASNGRQEVNCTVASIKQLAQSVVQAADVIQELNGHSNSIGNVLHVITGIAEQTNLLALNAAIEAARAGEQGRGFAVVADEVRSLAKRTQDSTQEIQETIKSLRKSTDDAVSAMEDSRAQAGIGVEQADKTRVSLEQIIDAVSTITDMTSLIACASEEQRVVAEEINKNIISINDVADSAAADTQKTVASTDTLQRHSNQMLGLVQQFKV